MTTTEPELVTLPCDVPGCGDEVTGPASGAGSVKFKLASHRYRVHGIKADGSVRAPKAPKGRAGRPAPEESARPAMAVVRELRDEVPPGTAPPTTDQLTRAAGHALELAALTVASYAAETEEGLTDRERDEITAYLSLSTKQANEMVRPLAKLAQPTRINKKFGRQAVENVDAFAAVLELGELVMHWRRYLRQRSERKPIDAEHTLVRAVQIPTTGPEGAPVSPGGTATTAQQIADSGDPGKGVVVDAEMVKRLHRG